VNLRTVRLLVEHKGNLLRLCNLVVVAGDASVYIVAHGPTRRYYYGVERFPAGQRTLTFNFAAHKCVDGVDPKISLHERGQAHVTVNGRLAAGPIAMPPLAGLRGEHVATVTVDRFVSLAPYRRKPRDTSSERDLILVSASESGRVAIYANGAAPTFADECEAILTMRRPTLEGPLHVGIKAWPQNALGDGAGVTMLGGADPSAMREGKEAEFLFIRGL
jgi:hypothetical protein